MILFSRNIISYLQNYVIISKIHGLFVSPWRIPRSHLQKLRINWCLIFKVHFLLETYGQIQDFIIRTVSWVKGIKKFEILCKQIPAIKSYKTLYYKIYKVYYNFTNPIYIHKRLRKHFELSFFLNCGI